MKQYIETKHIITVMIIAAVILFLLSQLGYMRYLVSNRAYNQISQEEAVQMMEEESGWLIVDVRRPEEYAEGHIPGAVNIPNETIGDKMPDDLPDKDQILLIYCRSGNRSKDAAQKLSDLGYANIYEFGGINSWTGDIVTE